VDNHRPLLVVPFMAADVGEIESDRELEIKLNSGTLVVSTNGIIDLNVDLWSIECSITRVENPLLSKFIQAVLKFLLCLVPELRLSKELLWPRGQVEFECESKHIVHSPQEVQAAFDLILDLVHGAEDVGVVLLEAPNAGETSQGSRQLIPV